MRRFRPQCWMAGLLILGAAATGAGADTTAPVAVLDFSVPTAESNRWAWAESGMADLLQIELQQQGVPQLDRDLIHAVLKEQRLAADGRTAPDYLALAKLLNVRHLVSGRVVPLDGGRLRVEVSAFSVETVETVLNATGEGNFPAELTPMLRRLAREVADNFRARGVSYEPAVSSAPAPKPEALIMFYRGLNACAGGQPEAAVAWFMNAASLDPEFTVPLLWEIKAYEMAGFAPHAALRRDELAGTFDDVGVEAKGRTNPPTTAGKPVLAVLDPVVSMQNTAVQAASLGTELTHALLATDRVRVFAFKSLGAAVAEQDLKLSGLFARQHAPRYGRWLASDGLVLCRVSPTNANQITFELSLVDPLTAIVQTHIERTGPASALPRLIRDAAGELLAGWTNGSTKVSPPNLVRDLPPTTAPGATDELRPVYRGLVESLARFRREPQKSDSHRALADAFAATGRPKLAAYEVGQHLKTMDIHAPNADRTFLETHGWADGSANPQLIANMIGQLLDTYPDSLAAGCLRYNLAVTAWRAKNWPEAVTQAAQSRRVLQALIARYDRTAKTGVNRGDSDCTVAAATFFLEGTSLHELGRPEEAKVILQKGLAFMNEYQLQDSALPYGPMIGDFFGPQRVYGYGGDRPGIKTRMEQELAAMEGRPYPPPGAAPTTKPETIASTTSSPVGDPDSGTAWVKRGQIEVDRGNYREALDCYQRAVTKGVPPLQCAGLNTVLVDLALERDLSHPAEAAQRLRQELGLVPGEVSWVEWFAAGRKYQTSRTYDYSKAVACYRSMIQFMENPGKGGFYHLEKEPCCDRYNLRWGPSLGEVDLLWTANYDARWYSAAFYLVQCLIAIDQKEEAAEWLRRIAIKVGGDNAIPLLEGSDWTGSRWSSGNLGVRAAQMLKELHDSLEQPKFGEADGPYKTPLPSTRAIMPALALPPIAPEVMLALTNALAQSRRETNESARLAGLQSFCQQHPQDVVPAALTLLPNTGDSQNAADLIWLLEMHAKKADAPWIVAACQTRWQLVPLANRLDANATAIALAVEWRSHSAKNFIPPDLIHAIVNARVRPMFAPVIEQISGKWVNHHMVVFLMDRVVAGEKSDELEAAYRVALGRCLKLKLEQNDHYELSRISQIALRHGVPEAIEATVTCESASPEKLRKLLAPLLDLPAGDAETLTYLRTHRSRWEWDSVTRKFKPRTNEKL